MAADPNSIRLRGASYELLPREAKRRGVEPDALADDLLYADLGGKSGDLETALAGLGDLRTTLPEVDGVALAREARIEAERRSA
jgi:hypothetical protein